MSHFPAASTGELQAMLAVLEVVRDWTEHHRPRWWQLRVSFEAASYVDSHLYDDCDEALLLLKRVGGSWRCPHLQWFYIEDGALSGRDRGDVESGPGMAILQKYFTVDELIMQFQSHLALWKLPDPHLAFESAIKAAQRASPAP